MIRYGLQSLRPKIRGNKFSMDILGYRIMFCDLESLFSTRCNTSGLSRGRPYSPAWRPDSFPTRLQLASVRFRRPTLDRQLPSVQVQRLTSPAAYRPAASPNFVAHQCPSQAAKLARPSTSGRACPLAGLSTQFS
ncbi:hypothetical protein F2Q69_00011924 [Brassica cretica]|uniref:Uncharacterized protein n=1 Tax=Brassica cretica TaxID=69181 RepID=A0A8S9QYU8_BRACR|nr:hypothetical protein F2Q69_00011924 [Brassica cretica]